MQTSRQNEIIKESSARNTIRNICYEGMFVAIISVCAGIAIPTPSQISFTLQLLGICLASGLLGWKRGLITVAAYILLGLCGMPIFSNFTGGAAKIVSPSGGYIIGFLLTAISAGIFSDISKKKSGWIRFLLLLVGGILGVILCYVFGTAWFLLYFQQMNKTISLTYALSVCVVPYIIPDLIKVVVACLLTIKLKKYVKL